MNPIKEMALRQCEVRAPEDQKVGRLRDLRRVTNGLLAKADPEEFSGEPVRWGDLECTAVEFVVTDEELRFRRVLIEKASPRARKLADYLIRELTEDGWGPIEVHMQW